MKSKNTPLYVGDDINNLFEGELDLEGEVIVLEDLKDFRVFEPGDDNPIDRAERIHEAKLCRELKTHGLSMPKTKFK